MIGYDDMNSIDGLKRFQATSISRDHGNFQMAFSIYGCGFSGLVGISGENRKVDDKESLPEKKVAIRRPAHP